MDIFQQFYPANPDYGTGIFRRRVRIEPEPGRTTGILNDCYHSIRAELAHDGKTVSNVTAALDRAPKTTCPSAAIAFNEIRGLPVNAPRRAFYTDGRAARNCTHLLDLALLALGAVGRGDGPLVYDIAIPDRHDDRTHVTARINGQTLHEWAVHGDMIEAPCAVAGRPLFRGFAAWAEDTFSGRALDAARIVQKSLFVAKGRAYAVDGPVPLHAERETHRIDDCFSFSDPQRTRARDLIGYVRDYTDGVEEPNLPDHLRDRIQAREVD